MVIHHQSLGPHSGYFKIGSTDLSLNGCNIENFCKPAINIFLQQTSVFSIKCFIQEKEKERREIVLLDFSSALDW